MYENVITCREEQARVVATWSHAAEENGVGEAERGGQLHEEKNGG